VSLLSTGATGLAAPAGTTSNLSSDRHRRSRPSRLAPILCIRRLSPADRFTSYPVFRCVDFRNHRTLQTTPCFDRVVNHHLES
jgi:hypothetical protein